MKYTRFYVVRHGESDGNIDRIIQGHFDSPLSKYGISQAEARAKTLKNIVFSGAFSSDLLRAKRTAEIIALEHKLVVTATRSLRERKFGQYEGKSYHSLSKKLKKMLDQWYELSDAEWAKRKLDSGFESGEEIVSRFFTFIREIGIGYSGQNVLVVCHGDLMRNVLVHLGFGDKKTLRGNAISNTSYFILDTDGIEFFVRETEGIEKKES